MQTGGFRVACPAARRGPPMPVAASLPRWSRFAVLLIAVLLAACGEGTDTAQAPQQPQAVPVGVVRVAPEPVTVAETFVGRIEAQQKVEVRARVSGFLEERMFDEGEVVRQGQPLFRIERQVYEAVVEQRRADLASAEAERQNADIQLGRARDLAQRNNIAQATVDEREAAARSAEAAVLQARAALRLSEIDLGYTDIQAPIAGRIGRALYDVGDLVGPDAGALAEIVTQDPIFVIFPVSQRTLLDVQQGAGEAGVSPDDFVIRLRLTDGTDYPHPGRVDFLGISVDQGTDTVPVRAVVPNPEGLLRDGQFVQAVIERAEQERAITVSQSAIQTDQQGNFVLAVNGEGLAEIRRVETGETLDRGRVVVRSGLNEGDQVIVQGIQRVRPGAAVEPRPAEDVVGGA
jgi:membrane fusion protein, multidrug efflux system